ncbi:hypothetical protein EI94DRAFT_1703320 [Lactarius quietus]|nr:hypothetical protein EI94DRAFT_1703320 [Lactarius quietus]
MAKHPSVKAVSFNDLAHNYGAVDFQDALADFIAQTNHPTISGAMLFKLAANTLIPFRSVPVYHKIKFSTSNGSEIVDSIQIQPEQKDKHGCPIPSRFDTVLVRGKDPDTGAHGTNVFEIPRKVIPDIFPSSDTPPPEHLTYVEWFSPIPMNPGAHHLLYKVWWCYYS